MPKEPQFDDPSAATLRNAFRESLPLPSPLDPVFEQALRHVLMNPGSMIRPRMVLRVASAYDLDDEAAHNVAIALEYFHTASLIFDDLPCMDNAVERRGATCIHVEFGEASAILSALALINRAYALMWRAVAACPMEVRCRGTNYLEKRLGVEGLLNGQSLDLHYSALPHTLETTERIARGKTVSLIRLTLVLPAILAGAPAREIQLLERIAVCWGLGYQILDDLKDVLQSATETGKTAARDQLLDRPNVAAAIGICAAVERLERLMAIGDRTLQSLLNRRPALAFLSKLRSDLEGELRAVTDSALHDPRPRPFDFELGELDRELSAGETGVIFLKLILTNLRRHRIRSLISIAGIAFSVAAMLTVVTILQGAIGMFSSILSSDSEIIVFERNVSDLFFSNVPASVGGEITHWPAVDHADPVLFGIVSSADHPIITCFGVTPQDARIRKAIWLAGNRVEFGRNNDDVVLGARAADFLNATLGSRVPIGHGTFHVIGIVKTANGFEDGGVFMPIPAAQSFFHKDGSSVVTVKLRNKDDAAAFKAQIRQNYPSLIALEDAEFSHSYSQFKILKATAWAVGGCGLILGGLGVANTMIMSVFTRIRELAILRVNGFSRTQIAAMIFGESSCVAAAGAVVGLSVGILTLFTLKHVPAMDGYVDASLRPSLMLVVIVLALLTGIAGALYPAAYAMRIRAVEALRFE